MRFTPTTKKCVHYVERELEHRTIYGSSTIINTPQCVFVQEQRRCSTEGQVGSSSLILLTSVEGTSTIAHTYTYTQLSFLPSTLFSHSWSGSNRETMPSSRNLPRHKEDIIRIIDLAFVKFERRLQACLDEASGRIVTEAETAQAYVKGQLNLLKSNILKGLDDPEPETAPRGRHTAYIVRTEPPRKRTWPAENVLGVSSSVTTKKTRYSDISIDEARRELAAERSAQKEQFAVERSARKEQRALEKSVKKEQLLAGKDMADIGGRKGEEPESPLASTSESSSEEEKEEDEGSEHDSYRSESEDSSSGGYKTPPSPTPPTSRRESRTTLPDRKSDSRVSYPGAPIHGL